MHINDRKSPLKTLQNNSLISSPYLRNGMNLSIIYYYYYYLAISVIDLRINFCCFYSALLTLFIVFRRDEINQPIKGSLSDSNEVKPFFFVIS